MTRVLDVRRELLGSDDAPIGFRIDSNLRKLTVDGESVYDLSVWCTTCSFLFQRVGVSRPSSIPISVLVERLRSGLTRIDEEIANAFAVLLPKGDYLVALLEIEPKLVMPGDTSDYFGKESVSLFGLEPPFYDLPENPHTPYYRVGSAVFEPPGQLYGYDSGSPYQLRAQVNGFLAPMESISALDPATVESYRQAGSDTPPTAVAISVVDVKSPSVGRDGAERPSSDGVHAHWCWAHFLLDGHHKVRAASLSNRPLTLLSFTALHEGVSTSDQVDQLVSVLS